MNEKRIKLALEDIILFISKIERYSKNLNKEKFEKSEMVIDAVLRNLELIGEASKKLPNDFKKKYPNIPWKSIIGLRNIVIHTYADVDLDIIWDIITKNIPKTKEGFKLIYDNLKGI